MELAGVLTAAQDDVLDMASDALQRSHLEHYAASGPEQTRCRLEALYLLVIACLAQRTLVPISKYGADVAEERFEAGFQIGEVQTAFNALEEAIWHVVIARLPTGDLLEATGLIGTVLGTGKDALARAWVSAASNQHVRSLDLTALFEGTAS